MEAGRKLKEGLLFCNVRLLFLTLGAAADGGNDFCFLEKKCGKELAMKHPR